MLIQEKPRRSLPTADDVEAASTRIADEVITTPLHLSDRLSTATGAQVYLKREDLQSVRSYKIRGAFNFLLQLSEAERKRGVVCASAGNHAQGLARACAALGVSGTIFVPKTTPRQKIERIRHFGGRRVEVVIEGSTYDDASDLAKRHAQVTNALVVSAFDDPLTIAGQGTIAQEIHAQLDEDPDVIVVPVGGGGLLAGGLAAFWLTTTVVLPALNSDGVWAYAQDSILSVLLDDPGHAVNVLLAGAGTTGRRRCGWRPQCWSRRTWA